MRWRNRLFEKVTHWVMGSSELPEQLCARLLRLVIFELGVVKF